jgi:heat shock protein HslJ
MLRLAIFFLVATTAVANAQGVEAALAGGKWQVVEIEGAPAAFAETLEFSGDKVVGNGACNRFTGTAKQDGQTLQIAPLASSRMVCEGRMDAETRYFGALRSVCSFARSGDTLSLLSADGRILVKLKRQT